MKCIPVSLLLFALQSLVAQKPLLVVPTGHSGGIRTFSCSADGAFFLTLGSDNLIKLWNTDGKELRTFQSARAYTKVYVAPDVRQMLAVLPEREAYLIDISTGESGEELALQGGHTSYIINAAYSPDGKLVATVGADSMTILWSAETGKIRHRLQGHHADVVKLGFSPDGKQLATLGRDAESIIWSVKNGKILHRIAPPETDAYPFDIAFSPDGKWLLVAANFQGVHIYNRKSYQLVHNLAGYSGTFSPDGRFLCLLNYGNAHILPMDGRFQDTVASYNLTYADYDGPPMINSMRVQMVPDNKRIILDDRGSTEVHDLETGAYRFSFKGYSSPVQSACFSPDGQRGLITTDSIMKELDFETSQRWKKFSGHHATVPDARYTPDGQQVVSTSYDFFQGIWDANTGKRRLTIKDSFWLYPIPHFQGALAVSPDGQYYIKATPDLITYGIADGIARDTFLEAGYSLSTIDISDNGRYIASTGEQTFTTDSTYKITYYLNIWDVRMQHPLLKIDLLTERISAFRFLPGSRQIVGGNESGQIQFWDIPSGIKSDSIYTGYGSITAIDFSPDHRWMVFGDDNGYGAIWDLETREIVFNLTGHTNGVSTARFSPDSRWVMTSSYDRTVRLWDVASGKEIASIILIGPDDWAITTPEGLFDASPGAMYLLYFVVEKEALELDQLKARYYEPGLLPKLMGYSDEPLRSVGTFADLALYPVVKTVLSGDSLTVSLTPRNGGIGKVSLFINGTERQEDINPDRVTKVVLNLSQFERFCRLDTLNTIALRAYNAEGWLKSMAYSLPYTRKGSKGTNTGGKELQRSNEPPNLYAIVVGTSNYAGTKLDLRFPDVDASAIAEAITNAGKALFENRIQVTLLHSGKTSPEEISSKSNIHAAFVKVAALAKLNDILVVYFSGHGVTYGSAEKAQFYYLTKDIASEDLSDPEIRDQYALSSNELTQWLTAIPAEKRVLILDACSSGRIVEDFASLGKKDLSPSQIRAFDRMKDRTGMFILTGSAANKVSYEASQYGQGLLTYSLLEGMSGLAVKDDKRVDVMTLFQHARDIVPDLAKGIGGIQTPVLAFPANGSSFDIGIVTKDVKIPIMQVKPVFIRNNFQEETAFDDVLGLNEALSLYFQDLTAKGAQAEVIYVDVNEHDNAFSLKGRYKITGETVDLTGKLFKSKTSLGEFKVTGKKDNLPGLIEAMMEQVWSMLE